MVAVHRANGPLAHVARHNQHAFLHQKNEFAEVVVGKPAMQLLQFRVGQIRPCANQFQRLGYELARLGLEKPETRHGGIINGRVIVAETQRQGFDLGFEVQQLVAIGHAVVAEDVEADLRVMLARRGQKPPDPLLVLAELGPDFRRLIADAVQQAVQFRPIDKGEVYGFADDAPPQVLEILRLALAPVR